MSLLLIAYVGACTPHEAAHSRDAGLPPIPTEARDAAADARAASGDGAAGEAPVLPSEDAGSVAPDAGTGEERSAWTVLVYMAADNNLEKSAMADLSEMAKVPTGKGVRIVAQVDRAEAYYELGVENLAPWTSSKRLEMRDGALHELADLGESNTGDPEGLADFIEFGVRSYPAERFALVLWNHGNSWLGYGGDESPALDQLSLSEIGQGITEGMQRSGLAQFELLGFDACLMATYDVLPIMARFGRYLLASEELEPGHGWDYAVFERLAEEPALSAVELGKALAEGFYQQAREERVHTGVTLALLDLAALPGLTSAVDALVDKLDRSVGQEATELGRARAAALSFGDHADPTRAYHVVDIGDLANELGEAVPALVAQRDAVVAALDELVVHQVTGRLTQRATGTSLYFPPQQAYYQTDYGGVASSSRWKQLLGDYYELAAQAPSYPLFIGGVRGSVGAGANDDPALCGDGICHTRDHETPANCPADCAGEAITYDHAACEELRLLPATPTRPVRTEAVCHGEYMLQCFLEGPSLRPRVRYCPDSGRTCRGAWDDPLDPGAVPPGEGCVIPAGGGVVSCGADGSLIIEGQLTEGSLEVTSEARLKFGAYVYFEQRPVVFGVQPASVDGSGKVRGAWNQRVLTIEQAGTQQLLFAETTVDDEFAYHEIPLVYRGPSSCPCLLQGEPGYADTDGDRLPDCADQDVDADGLLDKPGQLDVIVFDNCPWVANPSQEDADGDGTGDACEEESRKPVLSCEPVANDPEGEERSAYFRVTTELASGKSVASTLYVRSATGVSELHPEAGGRLSPMFLKQGVDGWQWEVDAPLSLDLGDAYSFQYGTLDLPALDSSGVPMDDANGKLVSLRERERLHGYYLELEALNFAGQGDSIFQFGENTCALPALACPAGEIADCQSTCWPATMLGDLTCDDGLRGANFDCFAQRYDAGDCLLPACSDGRMRTCSLSCLSLPEELGDGRCDGRLNCKEHDWDGGDCPCPNGCSERGTCVDGVCACLNGHHGRACELAPDCGDGSCDAPGEDCSTCALDCSCSPAPCGDGVCQPRAGDTCQNCPEDCGACGCGDGACTIGLEDCASCAEDCGACPHCGDGLCQRYVAGSSPFTLEEAENCGVCPQDCGLCLGRCCYSSEEQGQNFVGGGCQLPDVAFCVCRLDPTCCQSSWPERCVELAQGSCGLSCEPVPDGWSCPAVFYGDSTCDCGCGAQDRDCRSNAVAACRFDNCGSGQDPNPADPTSCVAQP